MTDEYYRTINRALMYLEDDDEAQAEWREKARTALHHIFGREKKLREEREEAMQYAREGVESERSLVIENANLAGELARLRQENVALRYEADGLGEELARLREAVVKGTNEDTRLRQDNAKLREERDDFRQQLLEYKALPVEDYLGGMP